MTVLRELLKAINVYERELRRDAGWLSSDLATIRTWLIGVTSGQVGSEPEQDTAGTDDKPMPRDLLSYRHTAEVLDVSETTVKRLVRAGHLHAVHVFGAARIPRTEVDRYVAGLTPAKESA